MGLFNILIVNPGLRMMYNIAPKRPAHENTFSQRISDYLVELIKSIFIVFVVALIYMAINKALIGMFAYPVDAVPLPGEPILFGVFYIVVLVLLDAISKKAKQVILNLRNGKAA